MKINRLGCAISVAALASASGQTSAVSSGVRQNSDADIVVYSGYDLLVLEECLTKTSVSSYFNFRTLLPQNECETVFPIENEPLCNEFDYLSELPLIPFGYSDGISPFYTPSGCYQLWPECVANCPPIGSSPGITTEFILSSLFGYGVTTRRQAAGINDTVFSGNIGENCTSLSPYLQSTDTGNHDCNRLVQKLVFDTSTINDALDPHAIIQVRAYHETRILASGNHADVTCELPDHTIITIPAPRLTSFKTGQHTIRIAIDGPQVDDPSNPGTPIAYSKTITIRSKVRALGDSHAGGRIETDFTVSQYPSASDPYVTFVEPVTTLMGECDGSMYGCIDETYYFAGESCPESNPDPFIPAYVCINVGEASRRASPALTREIWTVSIGTTGIVETQLAGDVAGYGDPACDSVCLPGREPDGVINMDDLRLLERARNTFASNPAHECLYIPAVDLNHDGEIEDEEVEALRCNLMADYDRNGFLDFFDYDSFVYDFENGGGCEVDANGDEFVDFFDLALFTEMFEGASCPPPNIIPEANCGCIDE